MGIGVYKMWHAILHQELSHIKQLCSILKIMNRIKSSQNKHRSEASHAGFHVKVYILYDIFLAIVLLLEQLHLQNGYFHIAGQIVWVDNIVSIFHIA